MTELAVVERPQRREITQVIDPVPILDSARFEHMQRIANVLARSSLIPESLRTFGPKDRKQDLPIEQVIANCFLVVNQAARWGMDPFAVISCCAVVHGRPSYEGKLVAAVLDAKLNVKLHHHFTGDPATDTFRIYLSDQPFTDEIIAKLAPGVGLPGARLWDGSVGEWKTTGAGTPWTVKNYRRMLIYRGTRDWTRVYEPAILLGVYTDDELLDLAENARAQRAQPAMSFAERLAIAPAPEVTTGFSHAHVTREIDGHNEGGADPDSAKQSSLESEASGLTAGQAGETPATESPGADPAPEQSSPDPQASGDGDGQAEGVSSPVPSGLPEGWERSYAEALRRAVKKDSLKKYAVQFWDQHGGWVAIRETDAGPTAAAIYSAFSNSFGNREAIDEQLMELGAI